MRDFKTLKVWQKAHRLTLAVYRETKGFPKDELYALTGQIRRASVSVPSNIAEGCGRGSDAEMARFFQIAMGSASEVEYQLLLARDLGFIASPIYVQLENDVTEIKRMLTGFIKKLRNG